VHNECGNSLSQLYQKIIKGQAPVQIERLDYIRLSPNEQPHIHFKGCDNCALNIDGTWKHNPPDNFSFSRKTIDWLVEVGWSLPW